MLRLAGPFSTREKSADRGMLAKLRLPRAWRNTECPRYGSGWPPTQIARISGMTRPGAVQEPPRNPCDFQHRKNRIIRRERPWAEILWTMSDRIRPDGGGFG